MWGCEVVRRQKLIQYLAQYGRSEVAARKMKDRECMRERERERERGMMRLSKRSDNGCNHKDRMNVIHFGYEQTALQNVQAWNIRCWLGGYFNIGLLSVKKWMIQIVFSRWRLTVRAQSRCVTSCICHSVAVVVAINMRPNRKFWEEPVAPYFLRSYSYIRHDVFNLYVRRHLSHILH